MTDLGKCDCGCWDYQQLKAEVERLREELRIARFDASTARTECDMVVASKTARLREALQKIRDIDNLRPLAAAIGIAEVALGDRE